jgi:hypothetical protein
MAGPSLVIVLVEDNRHQQFIRCYLKSVGLNRHAMRFLKSPSGRGSAEQWVRESLPAEVRAFRMRQARVKTHLIVLIDADNKTVQNRFSQLDQALQKKNMPPIDSGTERIARLVPKRNVETWILVLNSFAADEETDYKSAKFSWNKLIPKSAEGLYAWTRPNAKLPTGCVPSLRVGIRELKRLDF